VGKKANRTTRLVKQQIFPTQKDKDGEEEEEARTSLMQIENCSIGVEKFQVNQKDLWIE